MKYQTYVLVSIFARKTPLNLEKIYPKIHNSLDCSKGHMKKNSLRIYLWHGQRSKVKKTFLIENSKIAVVALSDGSVAIGEPGALKPRNRPPLKNEFLLSATVNLSVRNSLPYELHHYSLFSL